MQQDQGDAEGTRCPGQGVLCFRAKIGFDNGASQALFQRLGFREVCRVAVFREVTLEWRPGTAGRELLAHRWRCAVKASYDDQQTQCSGPLTVQQP